MEMSTSAPLDELLADLNEQQRLAACHGNGPLLIVAGAGTGKTTALVHRVAYLIASGVNPARILLLTFTRRAAAEMLRRAEGVLRQHARTRSPQDKRRGGTVIGKIWGGTFHAIATRLLRRHAKAIGMDPAFTIHDRTDSQDLLGVIRTELGLSKTDRRFPHKATCMDIYSRCVNARQPLEEVLQLAFPWCLEHADDLKHLFRSYVDRKAEQSVLDYDDLLLFWHALLSEPGVVSTVRDRFDCVLVDEYQDTNLLQAEILQLLRPDGRGLTVVGDDAQSIYSFRAATVRNILDFPGQFPGTTIVTLEQNYRSTGTILDATNRVIAQAAERYAKNLWTRRDGGQPAALVTCQDEDEQTEFLIRQILEHREAGLDLQRQAVLFRASHHSLVLELELSRRNIPFHKYGGLKFVETAHVKDLVAFLRLAENPRDLVAGTRVLLLLPGIGPKKSRQLIDTVAAAGGDLAAWKGFKPPAAAAEFWPDLVELLCELSKASSKDLPGQVNRVRKFYTPLLEQKYGKARARARDLEQLEHLASRFPNRRTLLAEMTLDPPASTQDLAGPPHRDDDYLILSTMHSAKGLEWDAVYVIHAADGNIPSDMATGRAEEIEEELRLFYIALTRAKDWLYVCFPLRYYWRRMRDLHGYAQLTRFLPEEVQPLFERRPARIWDDEDDEQAGEGADGPAASPSDNVRQRIRAMWT